MLKYFLLISFIVSASNVSAQNVTTEVDVDCNNAETQYALNYCSTKESKESGEALEKIYQEALSFLENQPERKASFIKAQEIWHQYSQNNCDAEAGPRSKSGTIWPYIFASCSARMNKNRIQEIKITVLGNQ